MGSHDPKGNSDPKDVPGLLCDGEGPGGRGPCGARVGGDVVCALVTHQPETDTLLCLHQLKQGPQSLRLCFSKGNGKHFDFKGLLWGLNRINNFKIWFTDFFFILRHYSFKCITRFLPSFRSPSGACPCHVRLRHLCLILATRKPCSYCSFLHMVDAS